MKCPQCATENPEEAHFCMECGFLLDERGEPCPSCGNINPWNAKFCLECGADLKQYKESPSNQIPAEESPTRSLETEEFPEECPDEVPDAEYLPPDGSESWRELCPACNHNPLTPKTYKGILSTKNILECEYCGAVFEQKGKNYLFKAIYDISSDFWKRYGRKTLTEDEWTRIAHGGLSNEEKRIMEQKAAQNDLVNFVNQLDAGNVNLSTIPNPPIMLKKGEEACVVLGGITLREARAVRHTRGAYGGPTIRVAKGVSFRMGSVAARSESHEELRNIDQGTLVLTNKRLVFIGSKRTINIDLRKIIAIEAYKDGIASQRENKQKTEYFTGTDRHALTFNINGRSHTVPFTGLILKAAVEGKIRQI
ncbi:MAG: zinc ribbon domain-containing protein [Methanobacteriaceae archaeon]|nr:zinc ribbon domain-containing protein [Methanobacteriaceae archaeon]